jgi:nucleotide-binding universal stress UspA family protein
VKLTLRRPEKPASSTFQELHAKRYPVHNSDALSPAPIVVGWIDTPEGRAALVRACSEAEMRSTRVVVVHSTTSEDDRSDEAGVRALVDERGGEVEVEYREVKGGRDVSDALLAVVEQVHAELVVIGLRRRSAVGKLILGSNAQRILLDAPCAVLAVKFDQVAVSSVGEGNR